MGSTHHKRLIQHPHNTVTKVCEIIFKVPNSNPTSPQQTAVNQQQFTTPPHNTTSQNVAPLQPSAPAPQPFHQSPVAHQQQQPLLQPPVPGSHAAQQQQGQLQFVQPRVSPQGQPIR